MNSNNIITNCLTGLIKIKKIRRTLTLRPTNRMTLKAVGRKILCHIGYGFFVFG